MAENMQSRFVNGYVIAAVGFLVLVVAWGTFYSFGVFFNPVLAEFHWTRAMTSGPFSLCSLLLGVFSVVMGRLNDRFGPKKVVGGCGILLGLGYILMSRVTDIWHLYLFYGILVGIGMSGTFVPVISTVARWFAHKRGIMTGLVTSGIGGGLMITPPIANWLISNFGWRTSYLVVGSTVAVLVFVASLFLKRDPVNTELKTEIKKGQPASQNIGLSFKQALHTKELWMLCAACFCYGFWLNSVMVHIVSSAIELGVTASRAAIILTIIGVVSLFGRIIMGSAGDRIGNRLIFVLSSVLVATSLYWLQLAKDVWALYAFAVIFAIGYDGCAVLVSPIIAELFGLSAHGVLLGFSNFAYATGGAIGPVVTGRIFDLTQRYQPAFLASALVSTIGLIIAFFLLRSKVNLKGMV